MGGVADKLLLAVVAALDAVQHGVNNHRQVLQLVFGACDIDAVAQIAGAQGGGHVGDVPNGTQHAFIQAVLVAQKADDSPQVAKEHAAHEAQPNGQTAADGKGYVQRVTCYPPGGEGQHGFRPPLGTGHKRLKILAQASPCVGGQLAGFQAGGDPLLQNILRGIDAGCIRRQGGNALYGLLHARNLGSGKTQRDKQADQGSGA